MHPGIEHGQPELQQDFVHLPGGPGVRDRPGNDEDRRRLTVSGDLMPGPDEIHDALGGPKILRRWLDRDTAHWAALPVVGGAGEPMAFRRWTPGMEMATDRYGIPFPAHGAPEAPELLLIPCNGFDARGYRLGYGAGHFDRTLAALTPAPRAVGIALEAARIDDLHPHPHDIPMDWIVTDAGIAGPFK